MSLLFFVIFSFMAKLLYDQVIGGQMFAANVFMVK